MDVPMVRPPDLKLTEQIHAREILTNSCPACSQSNCINSGISKIYILTQVSMGSSS